MIAQRLEKFREKMREYQIDVYLIPTADYHESEYVGGLFQMQGVSDRIHRVSGDSGDHAGRCLPLD